MLHRKEFIRTHPEVRTGMIAYNTGGERLGVIERMDDDNITIEQGRIFHKDVQVPYDDIQDVHDDDVVIRKGFEQKRAEQIGESIKTREPAGKTTTTERVSPRGEVKVPKRMGPEEARTPEPMREGEPQYPRGEEGRVEATEWPVGKEEVRVSQEPREEVEEVTGEVRKEKVKVDRTEPTRPK